MRHGGRMGGHRPDPPRRPTRKTAPPPPPKCTMEVPRLRRANSFSSARRVAAHRAPHPAGKVQRRQKPSNFFDFRCSQSLPKRFPSQSPRFMFFMPFRGGTLPKRFPSNFFDFSLFPITSQTFPIFPWEHCSLFPPLFKRGGKLGTLQFAGRLGKMLGNDFERGCAGEWLAATDAHGFARPWLRGWGVRLRARLARGRAGAWDAIRHASPTPPHQNSFDFL